jgi:hypothetical protein
MVWRFGAPLQGTHVCESNMKPFSAFSVKGKWLRGNCHTHTTMSDGAATPRQVVAAYRKQGYDFLVLTDHGKVQEDIKALQRKNFLVINGIELHPPTQRHALVEHHLIAIGIENVPNVKRLLARGLKSVIRWTWRNGGIPVYCHPYWSGHDVGHMEEGQAAFGMEAFNTVCHVRKGLGDAGVHLDQALAQGFRWRVFAVDDAHFDLSGNIAHEIEREGFQGWIMLKATGLTRAAVMHAMRKGRFYATTGPVFHSVAVRAGAIHVECSPVKQITLHSEGPLGTVVRASRARLTHAEFELHRRMEYARIDIIDANGGKAWTNPIYFDKKRCRWVDE